MMISIQSFMTYDSGFNYPKSNHLREVPVVIHSRDADRFMPQLEADLLARYIFAKHRRALETCDTLADGVDARFESLGGDTDALRLASNILAFLEFYLNRFTPLTDDTMRKYLSDARFTIAKLTEYTVGEDAPTKVGQVVNKIATMATGIPGVILFVAVFLFGHIFNLAIGLLGAYVHTSRLQYIEFFGRFFEDGGYPFRPLKNNTKFVEIVKED